MNLYNLSVALEGGGGGGEGEGRGEGREGEGLDEVGKRDQAVILDCIHVRYEAQQESSP